MTKSIRVSDGIYELAASAGEAVNRSLADQIEYWARLGASLDAAGITVNKNMIPYDPRKPMDPSGVRIGTPALTTRGMKDTEMKQIAKWIVEVLGKPTDDDLISRVRGSVRELCEQFPAPCEAA